MNRKIYCLTGTFLLLCNLLKETTAAPLYVDSVHYYSAGTESWTDDSLIVWFNDNLEFDSLPLGPGNADHAFSLQGRGAMANATLDTPVGCPDTNFVIISMNTGDTIMSHLRSTLSVYADSVWSAAGTPCQADTDSVRTYNVYNPRTGTAYQTIKAGMENSIDADTLLVLDEGFYTDTLAVKDDVVFMNAGVLRPVIKFNGDTTTIIHGSGNANGYLVIDAASYGSEARPEFHGFEFDGRNIAGTDTVRRLAGFTNGKFHNCVFHHADHELFYGSGGGDNDSLVIDSCEFYASGTVGIYSNKSNTSKMRINGCIIHDNPSAGITMYLGDSTTISNNTVYDNAGAGLYFRNGDANIVLNNIIRDNGGSGIQMYNAIASDLPTFNKLINNTVYNNAGGGMMLDSMGIAMNNISYGNTGWQIRRSVGAGIAEIRKDSIMYNLADSTGAGLGDSLTSANGNIVDGSDPLFSDTAGHDFHLRVHSPCIDRGDTAAAWADHDGGRCDMGAYGGPNAMDTAMPPRLDTLIITSGGAAQTDSVIWTVSGIADFNFYAVYRDTVEDFVPTQSLCIDSVSPIGMDRTRYGNGGKFYYYKMSVVDDTSYGGGYASASYGKMEIKKRTASTGTAPGDTVTYTIYYDNDGLVGIHDTASIVDYVPKYTMFLDTLGKQLHTGGTMVVDYLVTGSAWQTARPSDPDSVKAVRWKVSPDIGAQSGTDDPVLWDISGTGIDTNAGDDAGWVRFQVRIR